MRHHVDSFKTPNKLQIHTESWLPDGAPRAAVFIVHGYAEHIGRYAPAAERFVQRGYAVYGMDHQGHGKSDGLRVYFDSLETPVADLKAFFEKIRAAHPDLPVFMWGHSMGSLLALSFALRYQNLLAGLLLSGVAVDGDKILPAPLITAARGLARIVPRSRLFPAVAAPLISHDAEIVAAYQNDPLVDRGGWRVGMGYLLIDSGRKLRARAGDITLPVLLLHGGDDKITPVSGAEYLYQQFASADKTLKVYPGLYHEVHNETEKDKVLADMLGWLDQRTA